MTQVNVMLTCPLALAVLGRSLLNMLIVRGVADGPRCARVPLMGESLRDDPPTKL